MTIDWWTLALQAINFVVLVWLLQRFLYKPALAVIARRKAQVEQAFDETDRAKEAAAAAQQKFEASEVELAQSRQELMRRTHVELETERQQILEDARLEAAAMLDGARQQIETERAAALADNKEEIAGIAVDMAAGLLRQVAGGPSGSAELQLALNESFHAQLIDRLEQLPEEERRTLHQDLTGSTEGLRLVTGTALSAAEQERWRAAIAERLGPLDGMTFQVEPDIIGGFELRFPHAVLSLAWSELLNQGRLALLSDESIH
jgi:F-type H+-transporting ATPase subunit b